ncbi:hypothetical protein [Streptomyces parvulus]|uniref:hypothetical protein n=1 Tax=Streptomyces parvulus TaxID=146923 RepID=UPI00369E186E
MNKFDLINTVLTSNLKADDKCLLIELIVRSDESWESYPGVKRLCKVRGIKHQKNFKGVQVYLPDYVSVTKRGRKNFYVLDVEAIAALEEPELIVKETPSTAGVNSPATADNTPSVADNSPSAAGANTTNNTSLDSSPDSSNNAAVPAAQEAREETEAKEDKGSSVDSSLPVVTDASSLPSSENDAADTAEDWDEEFECDLGTEIEALLEGAEHPSEARVLFLDPEWKPEKTGELRARWAAWMAEPALTH